MESLLDILEFLESTRQVSSKHVIGYLGIWGEDSQMASFLAPTSFFQLFGSLFSFVGWCLCITATVLGQWRQWYIAHNTKFPSGVMWVGIWEVCYDTNPPDVDYFDINCKPFEAHHFFLPTEIFIAQDLMSLCAVVQSLTLGFFFFAYWNIIKNENKKRITFTFFTIGGFLSLASGTVVLIPVTWNMLSILNNKGINFPESFDMPSHPDYQSPGVAIHLGFASAVLQIVSGLLFLGNKCFLIHKKIHPLDCEEGPEVSSGKDSEKCPHCGSSLNVVISGHSKHVCEASRDKEKRAESEGTFQIPMGPIPDQRVPRSDTKAFSIVRETSSLGSNLLQPFPRFQQMEHQIR